jgi:hypothetical protein
MALEATSPALDGTIGSTQAQARRVGKTWRSRNGESDLQGGKTGAIEKKDLPGGRSTDSRFVMRLAWISSLVSAPA